MSVDVDDFELELECDYKSEHYSVRDNGAIMRHPKEGKKPRKLDECWKFGKPNDKNYLCFSSEQVHRIVATTCSWSKLIWQGVETRGWRRETQVSEA